MSHRRSGGQPHPPCGQHPVAGARPGDDGCVEEVPVPDVRVLIVDDQEPFRRAMAAVVEETDGFVVGRLRDAPARSRWRRPPSCARTWC